MATKNSLGILSVDAAKKNSTFFLCPIVIVRYQIPLLEIIVNFTMEYG